MITRIALLKQYQSMIFEMFINQRLIEEQFDLLASLSEGMETDSDAVELAIGLRAEDFENKDIVDCILAKHFRTARIIKGDDVDMVIDLGQVVIEPCPWD